MTCQQFYDYIFKNTDLLRSVNHRKSILLKNNCRIINLLSCELIVVKFFNLGNRKLLSRFCQNILRVSNKGNLTSNLEIWLKKFIFKKVTGFL